MFVTDVHQSLLICHGSFFYQPEVIYVCNAEILTDFCENRFFVEVDEENHFQVLNLVIDQLLKFTILTQETCET